ncbi:hypothetical protein QBC46DRAFT_348254, partial [Diplogelasinospora grovesii]
ESKNAVATTWMVSFEKIRDIDRNVADILSFMLQIEPKSIPQSLLPELSSKVQTRTYLPHALRILQRAGAGDMEERYELSFWVGRCLQVEGRIKEAVRCFEECWRWGSRHFAEEHPDRLASQHKLAGAYESNGQIRKAVALLKQVVAVEERTLAEDHPSRLASQHALAGAYKSNGQIKKAVALLEQVVAVKERMLAEEHPLRLAS